MALSTVQIYMIVLLAFNFIGGFISIRYLISFSREFDSRFLSSRNPALVQVYCVIALATIFITTPINYYFEFKSVNSVNFFGKFTSELFHELCTTMLLIIILCRCWLLFFDYKFSEISSDLIWRSVVNASEENWFLSNRKTFGNLHFIICISLIFVSISLLSLCAMGSYVLTAQDTNAFHYLSMFGLAAPIIIFVVYLTMYKIKLINDIYLIHKEMKYLSYAILLRVAAFLIDLMMNGYDSYLFFYTMEVATTFFTVWIQSRWVINQLYAREKEKKMDLYFKMNSSSVHSPSAKTRARDANAYDRFLLLLIDIFDDESAFKVFIRHCTQELSVESILFLIEIAQFKATLQQYNACGIDALNFRFLDVMNSNFVKYIKASRKEEEDKQLVFHPLYDNISDNSDPDIEAAADKLMNGDTTIRLKTRPESAVASMKQEAEYKRFTETILCKKWLPLNLLLSRVDHSRNSGRKTTKSSGNSSRTKSSGTNSSHKKKKRSHDDGDETTQTRSKTSTKTKTKTKTKTQTDADVDSMGTTLTKTKSLSKTTSTQDNFKKMVSEFATPISLAVINDHVSGASTCMGGSGYSSNDNYKSDDSDHKNKKQQQEKKKKKKQQQKKREKEDTHSSGKDHTHSDKDSLNKERITVEINWMIEYGRYLYAKYVDNSANLAINISHNIRRDLWSVYSKEINEEAFQTIELIHHEDLSTISRLNFREEQKFIQTFIFHSFDASFHAVWQLLKSDTFYRFQKTTEYTKLCEDADAHKIQQAKLQRDREYSRSYNESHIDIV